MNKTLLRLKHIVSLKEGHILDKKIDNIRVYDFVNIKCSKGHTWKTKPHYLFQGSWCNKCQQLENQSNLFLRLKNIVKEREWSFSMPFTMPKNTRDRVKVVCNNGHSLSLLVKSLLVGKGICRKCEFKNGTYERTELRIKEKILDNAKKFGFSIMKEPESYKRANDIVIKCQNEHLSKYKVGTLMYLKKFICKSCNSSE